jgi:hypothetical protein
MRIEHDFEYDASWQEISDEFCAHDSEYQANAINDTGKRFWAWLHDKTRPVTLVQLLEIAEQLNDNGKWFIETLYEYMRDDA